MDDLLSRVPLTYTESPLLYWILGSVVAYALATNTLWVVRSRGLRLPPYANWVLQVGRFAYYLGIPYLALGGWPRRPFQGLLSVEDMGLVGLGGRWPVTRWLETLGTGAGFGLIAFLLLFLAWANADRAADGAPAGGRFRFPRRAWWVILIDVLYLGVHWAFYRGALAVVLDDGYAGVFFGLGLVYLEWAVNPAWREGWHCESRAAGQWLHAALALVVALLYLFTHNLWVCLGVHGVLELVLSQLGRERAVVPAANLGQSGTKSPREPDATAVEP